MNTINRTFQSFPLKQAEMFLNFFTFSYSRALIYSTFSFHNAFYCPDLQCWPSCLFYSDGRSTNIALETYWKINVELIKSSFDHTRHTNPHKLCRSLQSYIPLYQILPTHAHINTRNTDIIYCLCYWHTLGSKSLIIWDSKSNLILEIKEKNEIYTLLAWLLIK